MRRNYLTAGLVACIALSSTTTYAQQSSSKTTESDEIIIRKKDGKDSKITVEFKDGQVTVNGKQLSDFINDDVSITIRKTRDVDDAIRNLSITTKPGAATSPFRGGTFYLDNNTQLHRDGNRDQISRNFGMATSTNKALLGVATEKTDNGARITNVTKGSAAEKGGIKEGDYITKVDNTTIATPEELTAAIGKYKPEDKATVTYKRDGKDQKATVTLGKRQTATSVFGTEGFNAPEFNFDMMTPGANGNYNYVMRGNNLRLGIKAQDTEDGKGVKVLDVDDESNAAKAGIKEEDVITAFDGQTVNSVGDLMDAAKDMKNKNSIKVKLNRDGKSQEVEIKVPKKLKTATL